MKLHRRINKIPSVDAITKLQRRTEVFVETVLTHKNFCGQISGSQMKDNTHDHLMPLKAWSGDR